MLVTSLFVNTIKIPEYKLLKEPFKAASALHGSTCNIMWRHYIA